MTEPPVAGSAAGKLRKRRRVQKGAALQPETPAIHVALPETDALLALSGGAIASAPPITAGDGGRSVECWTGRIPMRVVRRLENAAGFGGTIVFKVASPLGEIATVGGRTFASLPIALSRVEFAAVASDEYLELLRSRVADFPDVVLDAVPIIVDANVFDATSEVPELFDRDEAVLPLGAGDDVRSASRADKVTGAIAGLLCGLVEASTWSADELTSIWNSLNVQKPEPAPASAMIVRVGTALAVDAPDAASKAFVGALVARLNDLGTRDGFEPTALLDDVLAAARAGVDAPSTNVLDQFATAATAVLRMRPGAPRDLLLDGGSVMLRGSLAFLQSPSIEKLQAMLAKETRLGPRVGTFALMLAGYYTGSTALARRYKAEPVERLLSLGDVTEATSRGFPISVSSTLVIGAGAHREWVATLQGRTVGRRRIPVAPELRVVSEAVDQAGWIGVAGGQGLLFAVPDRSPLGAIRAAVTDEGPFEPRGPRVALTLQGTAGTKKSEHAFASVVAAAAAQSLDLQLRESGKSYHFTLGVYLGAGSPTVEHVDAAVMRLCNAAMAIGSRSADIPRARKRREVPAARDEDDNTEPSPGLEPGPA